MPRIMLPTELRGAYFPRATMLELNDFDTDLLLPSFFFRVLSEGKGRARRVNDPTLISDYVKQLANHPDLDGFSGTEGERLLNRFVRTSLARTGRVGRGKREEQILSIVPFSVLSHKTGLPSEGSRQRNVDTFLYEVLRERSGSDMQLRQFVSQVFGEGVSLGRLPELGGSYDGKTELDTLTRLSLAFLDGFRSTPVGRSIGRKQTEACAGLFKALGLDIQHYLYAYHESMPSQALTYHSLGLINFELFVYTLKLAHGLNTLIGNSSELPPAMRDPAASSPPDIYVDFTGDPGGLSQRMAAACVRRDLEAYAQLLDSVILLKLLDRYVQLLRKNVRVSAYIETEIDGAGGSSAKYLRLLLEMADDANVVVNIDAMAQTDEDAIRQANLSDSADGADANLDWLDDLLPQELKLTPVRRVARLLVESQRRNVHNYARWFWGTGGLLKPNGILAGTLKGRRAWRYQPSNDLLAVLVQLAAIQPEDGTGQNVGPHSVGLREFLEFLHVRFGLLVDRPPAPFEGAEAVAASRDNLRAMLRRLRQMGIFRDLSDDFTVQALTPLYAAQETRV